MARPVVRKSYLSNGQIAGARKTMAKWWVTGASRGLGAELVCQLAAAGHEVLALARDRVGLSAVQQRGGDGVRVDLLDLAAGDALAARIHSLVAAHGLPDGIVHNAGIGWYRPIVEHDEATLRAIIQVNLTAVIQITHALLPAMIERGSGYVVAIGSDLGRRPLANMAAYVASKHGLNGFMHSLLREVKHAGLRVSLIQPGMIDTGFGGHETGRHARGTVLRPDALAKLIVQVVEQPDDLLVDELTVHPPGQGEF